jgi:hypothetical protein
MREHSFLMDEPVSLLGVRKCGSAQRSRSEGGFLRNIRLEIQFEMIALSLNE